MRLLVYLGLVFLLTPLQMTLFEQLSVFGVKPDLALLATYAVALVYGETDGVGLAALLGMSQDLFAGTTLGVHVVPLAIAGLIAGLMGKAIVNITFFFSVGGLFFVSVAQGLLRLLLFDGWMGTAYFLSTVWHLIVPAAMINCAIGAIAFLAWDRWEARSLRTAGGRVR